jgi:hypothetical protein
VIVKTTTGKESTIAGGNKTDCGIYNDASLAALTQIGELSGESEKFAVLFYFVNKNWLELVSCTASVTQKPRNEADFI